MYFIDAEIIIEEAEVTEANTLASFDKSTGSKIHRLPIISFVHMLLQQALTERLMSLIWSSVETT